MQYISKISILRISVTHAYNISFIYFFFKSATVILYCCLRLVYIPSHYNNTVTGI